MSLISMLDSRRAPISLRPVPGLPGSRRVARAAAGRLRPASELVFTGVVLRADHLGDPAQPLAEAVCALVKERTNRRPAGPIRLLTLLRTFGYYFSPLNLDHCFDGDGGTVEAVVAEVTNTPWLERHAMRPGRQPDRRAAWNFGSASRRSFTYRLSWTWRPSTSASQHARRAAERGDSQLEGRAAFFLTWTWCSAVRAGPRGYVPRPAASSLDDRPGHAGHLLANAAAMVEEVSGSSASQTTN